MSIAGISSSHDSIRSIQSSQDSYENNIKKQIHALEDKMKTISNDSEKPVEEKKKEKQAAQEQLQNLNQELKEYQIQKRQEEAEKKREALKEALASANESASTEEAKETEEERELPLYEGLSNEAAGVMITLSTTKEQLAGMVRVRTHLEGKQRTAATEEEKAELQKKINRISKGIGQKVSATKDTISDFHKTNVKEENKKPQHTDKKQEEVFWADTKTDASEKQAVNSNPFHSGKNKLFNDNASVVIK